MKAPAVVDGAMEFTVNKADLARELALLQGCVEKSTSIPILANVLIETAGDRIILTATDLDTALRTSCPIRLKQPGTITIPAKRLSDYVRALPSGEIQVKCGKEAVNL